MEQQSATSTERGDTVFRAEIQREIVKLHKRHFGRGPTKTKLYLHEDSILMLMFHGHTAAEGSLAASGDTRGVSQTRVDISEDIKVQYIEVVERLTGRQVVGFMSSSQQDPDLLSHVYVLQPTDLLQAVPNPE